MNIETKFIRVLELFIPFGVALAVTIGVVGSTLPRLSADSLPACPLSAQDGRTIVELSGGLRADKTEAEATGGPFTVSLSAGVYDITLVSFDEHSAKPSQTDQTDERWKLILKDSGGTTVGETSAISDLHDSSDTLTEKVDDGFSISAAVSSVTTLHTAYPASNAQSITPLCAAFDSVGGGNEPPIITLLGDDPIDITAGDSFADPGATADDPEDGDITGDIVLGGDTVDTAAVGSYVISYDVVDSQGAAAPQVTRTVNVNPPIAQCLEPKQGRIIVDFPDQKLKGSTLSLGPVSTQISAGEYKVRLTSFDSYTDRRFDTDQTNERWYISLFADSDNTANSTPSSDLIDGVDGAITTEVVDTALVVSDQSNTAFARHIAFDGSGLADSIRPVCAVFDPVPLFPQCSDGIDNDGDGLIDSADPACHTDGDPDNSDSYDPDDDDENSPPAITLIGDNPIAVTKGDGFTDPGATADDPEDGDITGDIVLGGDTVDTATIGSYVISYDVTDSDGASATQVTRTVNVTSGGGGGGGGGGSSTIFASSTPEPPVIPAQCSYLLEFLRIGDDNNPVEVRKLQRFLRDYERFGSIQETGFFGQETFDATSVFQERYRADVLDPWDLPGPTGYVYITTKKKVNEIFCQSEFPLSDLQEQEIVTYRAFLESLERQAAEQPEVLEEIEKAQREVGQAPDEDKDALAVAGELEEPGPPEAQEPEESRELAAIGAGVGTASLLNLTSLVPIAGLILLILLIILFFYLLSKFGYLNRETEPVMNQ